MRFREGALELLRRRWHVLTVATLAGHLTVFLLLLACLRTVGVGVAEVSLVEAFAAWSLVRILGALPLTPGGVGLRRARSHAERSSRSAPRTQARWPRPCSIAP